MQNNHLNITDDITLGFSIPGWQRHVNPSLHPGFHKLKQERLAGAQRCRWVEEIDDGEACGQRSV